MQLIIHYEMLFATAWFYILLTGVGIALSHTDAPFISPGAVGCRKKEFLSRLSCRLASKERSCSQLYV